MIHIKRKKKYLEKFSLKNVQKKMKEETNNFQMEEN